MVLILLTAGLGLRVVTQFAYRPALLYIDSYKYLTGTGGSDPAGYGILLRPLLWAGNLALVAGFQHLLGLAMAAGHGFALTSEGPDILYGRAAVAANCAILRLPADECSLCPSPSVAAAGIDEIINNAHDPYQSYQPAPGTTKEQATHDFDVRVLRQQSLASPLSVLRDAVRLFAVTRDGAASITPIARWQFQPVYPTYPPGVTPSFVAAEGQRYGGGGPVTVRPLATFLRAYQLDGGYTPGPLLAFMTGAGVIGSLTVFARRRKAADGTRQPGRTDRPLAAAATIATLSAVAVVLGADVFEFSWRYQLPALVTLPLAGVLGYLVIAGRAGRGTATHSLARHQRALPTGPSPTAPRPTVTISNRSVKIS